MMTRNELTSGHRSKSSVCISLVSIERAREASSEMARQSVAAVAVSAW